MGLWQGCEFNIELLLGRVHMEGMGSSFCVGIKGACEALPMIDLI